MSIKTDHVKYNPDEYQYGYLNKLCSCGNPRGMENGLISSLCPICEGKYHTGYYASCVSCGYSIEEDYIDLECYNCDELDTRGVYQDVEGINEDCLDDCKYCGRKFYVSLFNPTDDEVCRGCCIEPLPSKVKPAKH